MRPKSQRRLNNGLTVPFTIKLWLQSYCRSQVNALFKSTNQVRNILSAGRRCTANVPSGDFCRKLTVDILRNKLYYWPSKKCKNEEVIEMLFVFLMVAEKKLLLKQTFLYMLFFIHSNSLFWLSCCHLNDTLSIYKIEIMFLSFIKIIKPLYGSLCNQYSELNRRKKS